MPSCRAPPPLRLERQSTIMHCCCCCMAVLLLLFFTYKPKNKDCLSTLPN
eukprot:COSAG01_NODE_60_length_29981_cov_23.262533_14_plen_50_part_00